MSDLIRREDAITVLYRNTPFDAKGRALLDKCESEINDIPSADRPQGEWFKDDEGTFICSACGSGYKDQPTLMGKPMFKWCPLCGARMKGDNNE